MPSAQEKFITHFIKFSLVGVLNTVLQLSIFSLFDYLGLYYVINQAASFLLVNLITFLLNKKWTFQNKSKEVKKQFLIYVATRTFSLLFSLGVTVILVEFYGFSPFVCQIIAVFFNFVINFLVAQVLIFAFEDTNEPEYYVNKSFEQFKNLKPENSTCVYFVIPFLKQTKKMFSGEKNNTDLKESLSIKISQLNELFAENSGYHWNLLIVVEEVSGATKSAKIEEFIKQEFSAYSNKKIEIVSLSNLAPVQYSKLKKRESARGLSVIEGMKYAAEKAAQDDIILYNYMDNSSDLRLSGSLIASLSEGYDISISSRWHPYSTVVNRGIVLRFSSWFYNLFVIFLTGLDISDSQNDLKAFKAGVLEQILPFAREFGFSFDTELLLLAKHFNFSFNEIPVYWRDSKQTESINLLRDSFKIFLSLFRQKKYAKSIKVGSNNI